MDCVSPTDEVEQQLKEAGEQLAMPPSSTTDLLDLLDKIEHLLTFVGQAPPFSMQGALVPSMGALIADELIKHSDVDVRVSVASCLCEVVRITAPNAPYKDEIMKEIFELNVMAFGELSNVNGRSYYKAIHILESVAKVKSCLLMLDLECDALVLEMFNQFLTRIRTNQPHFVFSNMETIMTLVIQESDEIATELLSLLVSHARNEDKIVTPAPWTLAEKVLRNCYDSLSSYSQTITKIINSDPDDYAAVVAALCQNGHPNELLVTSSEKTNSTHKRDVNTQENGGSTVHSQPKKQRVAAVPKKIDKKPDTTPTKLDERRLKGKELEESENLSPTHAHESHSAKGQTKNKKNNSNQDTRPNSVQGSKEDLRRTRFQDKGSPSGEFSSKEKSKGTKSSTGKPEKQSTKTKGVAKGNLKTSGSLFNVPVKKEDELLSHSGGAGPSSQQVNEKVQNRKPSTKKHVPGGKNLQRAENLKYGKRLEGRRIKVWWPMDQMYYEGVLSTYDPKKNKHKVLYADGDEEMLDLSRQKWCMLDEMSSDEPQEEVADLPTPNTTSFAKSLKQKGNGQIEEKLSSPKSSSKTKPTKEDDNSSTMDMGIVELCQVEEEKVLQIEG